MIKNRTHNLIITIIQKRDKHRIKKTARSILPYVSLLCFCEEKDCTSVTLNVCCAKALSENIAVKKFTVLK